MRKKLFAGNWKMNMTPNEGRILVMALRAELDRDAAALAQDSEVMVAPPFLTIPAVSQGLAGSNIALGAQNVHFEDKGAFTGEVSAPMLRAFGVTYVIIGHSERRHIFHETDELIGKRVVAALAHRLIPILCVGETLAQRDSGKSVTVVLGQLQAGLALTLGGARTKTPLVIAYEPVWAIGTGRNATPEQAQEVHGALREALHDKLEDAAAVRILYGGSVSPDNVDSLMAKPDIDGALVGGASLKADSFARIVRARSG
ncbi:MAG: triose-phosphate isomerase [Candidatus Binataceae bacterium]